MCMRVTGHSSSSQQGAGSAQNASSGSPLDPTPAHNAAGNHFGQSTTQQPSQKPTGDRPEPRIVSEVPPATPTTCEVCGTPVPEDIREKTKPHTDRVLCIVHFSEWWNAQKEVQA